MIKKPTSCDQRNSVYITFHNLKHRPSVLTLVEPNTSISRVSHLSPVIANQAIGKENIEIKSSNRKVQAIHKTPSQGRNVSVQDTNGRTALHRAIENKQIDQAITLIQKGIDIHIADSKGWTPLHVAASEGLIEVMHALIDRGARLKNHDWISNENESPFHVAVMHHQHKAIALLLERDKTLLYEKDCNGLTCLHLAAERNDAETLNFLLNCNKQNEAFVNEKDCNGQTALHKATIHGNRDIMRALMASGGLQTRDYKGIFLGYTPLDYAMRNEDLEAIELLKAFPLKLPASIDPRDSKDITCQVYAY